MKYAIIVDVAVVDERLNVTTRDIAGVNLTTRGHILADIGAVTYSNPEPLDDLIGKGVSCGFRDELCSVEGYGARDIHAVTRCRVNVTTGCDDRAVTEEGRYFGSDRLLGWFNRHPQRSVEILPADDSDHLLCLASKIQSSLIVAFPVWLGAPFWSATDSESDIAQVVVECLRRGSIARRSLLHVQ